MPKVKKIYMWVGGSEKQVWPMGYQPGANTVAYYPLTNDLNDHSGNNFNPTNTSGTITFTTKDGAKCAYNNGGSVTVQYNSGNYSTGNSPHTWSMWAWKGSYVNTRQACISTGYGNGTRAKSMGFHYDKFWTGGWSNDTDHCDALMNQWALYTWTFDGTTTKAYLNGVLKNSKNMTYSVDSNNYSSLFSQTIQGANDPSQSFNGYMNDVIIENRARTAQEILNYYNQTKSNYGL